MLSNYTRHALKQAFYYVAIPLLGGFLMTGVFGVTNPMAYLFAFLGLFAYWFFLSGMLGGSED